MIKDSYKVKYFKELNSLRFLGFLGIFFGHVFFSENSEIINHNLYSLALSYGKILGFISLDSFFVLSSFLITWKALEEFHISGKFKLKHFLIRRTLRIWPLYFLIVFLGFFIEYMGAFYNQEITTLPSFWSFFLFILNYDMIINGYEFLFFMVFLWSISVEEQFYIFWSIVLKWFQKYLLMISILLVIVSLVFRYYFLNDSLNLNFNTISTLGNFGIGAIIAIAAFKKNKLFKSVKNLSKTKIISIYLFMILVYLIMPHLMEYDFFIIIQRLLFSIFFSFIILEQSYCNHSLFKLSIIKSFNFFGKISFGLYCYHGIVITIILNLRSSFNDSLFNSLLLFPILIFVLTLSVSYLSFQYYELKFLKLKSKFTLSN